LGSPLCPASNVTNTGVTTSTHTRHPGVSATRPRESPGHSVVTVVSCQVTVICCHGMGARWEYPR
jgi:hypothetical protein